MSQAAAPSAAATAVTGPQPVALPTATPAQRRKIADAAQAFEAQMLSTMMQPMFQGQSESPSGPFGGGSGEETYRSFMVDAIAKQTARAGGVGLAPVVMREMLKMQGLQ